MPDRLYFLLQDGTTYRMEVDAGKGREHRDWFLSGARPYNQELIEVGSGVHIRRRAVVDLRVCAGGDGAVGRSRAGRGQVNAAAAGWRQSIVWRATLSRYARSICDAACG